MRAKFDAPNLPFGVFLLAAWQANTPWFPLLRLVQVATSILVPNVFTASTLDRGQPAGGPVHSPFKQDPGKRASLALQSLVYGKQVPFLGPRYAGAVVAGSSVTVSFEPASLYGAGIVYNASVSCPSTITADSCEAFAILGSDCIWYANVTAAVGADDKSIILSLPAGTKDTVSPVATRGLFGNWPLVRVYNAAGLPAEPWLENIVSNSCPPIGQEELGAWEDDGRHA